MKLLHQIDTTGNRHGLAKRLKRMKHKRERQSVRQALNRGDCECELATTYGRYDGYVS